MGPVDNTANAALPPKAPGAFRVLHISDIHVGIPDWQWRYLLDKRCVGRLNQRLTRQGTQNFAHLETLVRWAKQGTFDAVLCTGDLTAIGDPREFQKALELLEPLRLACPEHFVYLPGNHDAYVPAALPPLREAFQHLNGGHLSLNDLPAALPLGPLEVVAFSGARPCVPWLSNGELPDDEWDKLRYILTCASSTEGKGRLLASHFPILGKTGRPLSWRSRLVHWRRLWEWGEEGRYLAHCSGHVHHPFLHAPHAPCAPWLIGAGSLTIRNSCAILDYNPETKTLSPQILRLPVS